MTRTRAQRHCSRWVPWSRRRSRGTPTQWPQSSRNGIRCTAYGGCRLSPVGVCRAGGGVGVCIGWGVGGCKGVCREPLFTLEGRHELVESSISMYISI